MNPRDVSCQPIKSLESSTIVQRIGQTDKSVIEDCVNAYGNLIWALAKRFTNSIEEAEEVTLKIFSDIWNCGSQYDSAKSTEEKYILKVAVRCLIKQSYLTAKS